MPHKSKTVIEAVNLDDVDVLEEGIAPAPILTIMSQESPTPPPTPPPSPPDTTAS